MKSVFQEVYFVESPFTPRPQTHAHLRKRRKEVPVDVAPLSA